MDIPEYFSNVVLAQFKATGIPLKVYVNGEYLIIPDVYEISDPLIGSGMDVDGNMNQFDYREIDHLLVGGNVIDLATYTKAMAGDTPTQDAKKDEEPKEESVNEAKGFYLKVALRDAKKALSILDDMYRKEFDISGSDTYYFKDEDVAFDAKMDLAARDIEITDSNIEESLELGEITKDVKKARQKAIDAEEKALKDKQKALDDEPITEANVDRPEEKKTAILNAIAKEEKRSEFQNRILNQIKRAIVDGEPLFKLPFKTQDDYRRLMKMYKIPFSSKRAEKGNLRAESTTEARFIPKSGTMSGGVLRLDNRKYQLRRDIKNVKIGNYIVTLPKGTILYNIPGGLFADHKSLEQYETRNQRYFKKSTFRGIGVTQKRDTIRDIEKNSRVLESIKKGSYVTNADGLVGRVDNISGDKEIADIRYNDGKEESLPIKDLKIFETNYTFGIGDIVKNKNTSCPHNGSMGIVQKIMKLANDMGMVVKYRVVNSGPTYNPGDSLIKTMDQLEPVQDPAETEAPIDEVNVRKVHGDRKVKNPDTGKDIKLSSALKAKKGTKVYNRARKIYKSLKDD
jgi:preprotein translocase subunit YajC